MTLSQMNLASLREVNLIHTKKTTEVDFQRIFHVDLSVCKHLVCTEI